MKGAYRLELLADDCITVLNPTMGQEWIGLDSEYYSSLDTAAGEIGPEGKRIGKTFVPPAEEPACPKER
ncbi:hypothetical protein V474_13450 [Novosphingobium barchaimii LL02]|uniref:Uncharacterized protein n=1 Tax=Novosphingobium barchaimii LL02 TaxID=1114963 RepID=A0A0J8AQA3_9SPHN|nr:hypothetical protein V474_13450 [Novosphingobium barchaimii LL02]